MMRLYLLLTLPLFYFCSNTKKSNMKEQVITETLNYLKNKYHTDFKIVGIQSLSNAGNVGNKNMFECSIVPLSDEKSPFLFIGGFPDNIQQFTVQADEYPTISFIKKMKDFIGTKVKNDNLSFVLNIRNATDIAQNEYVSGKKIPEILMANLDKKIFLFLYFSGLEKNLSIDTQKEIVFNCIELFKEYELFNLNFQFAVYNNNTPITYTNNLDFNISEDISKKYPFLESLLFVNHVMLGPLSVKKWLLQTETEHKSIPDEWFRTFKN